MRRFDGICIITQDVGRMRDFYRDVLEMQAEGDDTFIALSTEGSKLSFFDKQGMERMAPGSMKMSGFGCCSLEFEVKDVDKEYRRLIKMNIPIVKPPTTQPWGRRSVWFRDPDGNIINFYANVAV